MLYYKKRKLETEFYNIKQIQGRVNKMPIIQAVDRAMRIIDLFDEYTTELKITEISAKIGLHKSTVHSLLKTLMHHGYIAQDEESGKYRLGLKLVEKGQLLLQGLDIRSVAKRLLASLSASTGQTAHLVILSGREGVYIDKIEGERAAIRYSYLGRAVPLHCSAVGKVLAAYQPERKLRELLDGYVYTVHTPNTITSREAFLQELQQVRICGYAVDNQENEAGVRCVAAPVFDHSGHVIAAVSVSTLVSTVDDNELNACREKLIATVQAVSRRLGFYAVEEHGSANRS